MDLRLAGPAAACWVTCALALWLPLGATLLFTAGWILAAAVGWILLRHRRAAMAATVAGVCGVAAAAGVVCAIRIGLVESSPVRTLEGKPRVTVQVTGDGQVFAGNGGVRLPVKILAAEGRRLRQVDAVLLARLSELPETVPGERLSVRVRVRPASPGPADRLVAARLTAVDEPRVVGAAPAWQRWAGRVRARLRESAARALPPRAAGLLPGLVLGDTGELDHGLRTNFSSAGLTHLTAVSGANFSLVCGAVVLGVRLLGASTRLTV
ncbi:ComEC/Rec2 family competence protein, partial [Gordonia phosphorivorans]